MDETRRERRAPSPEQPERNMPPREEDPHATPLGRGADPGASVEGGPLSAGGVAGQHGHQSANAKGGPEGMLHRENEDAVQGARDAPPAGQASSPNDAGA